jgi:hypothetical protein
MIRLARPPRLQLIRLLLLSILFSAVLSTWSQAWMSSRSTAATPWSDGCVVANPLAMGADEPIDAPAASHGALHCALCGKLVDVLPTPARAQDFFWTGLVHARVPAHRSPGVVATVPWVRLPARAPPFA